MRPITKSLVIIVKKNKKTKPLIEEEKLIPLTQSSLLVEHNFIRSCQNSRLMQTVASTCIHVYTFTFGTLFRAYSYIFIVISASTDDLGLGNKTRWLEWVFHRTWTPVSPVEDHSHNHRRQLAVVRGEKSWFMVSHGTQTITWCPMNCEWGQPVCTYLQNIKGTVYGSLCTVVV